MQRAIRDLLSDAAFRADMVKKAARRWSNLATSARSEAWFIRIWSSERRSRSPPTSRQAADTMLLGLNALLISSLIDLGVAVVALGDSMWRQIAARSCQVANALDHEQLLFSDRIGTMAWNSYRHLQLYYGVSGSGRVLHTINPRLHPHQIAWIANHAEDQILRFDLTFLPLAQAVYAKCPMIKKWIGLNFERAHHALKQLA